MFCEGTLIDVSFRFDGTADRYGPVYGRGLRASPSTFYI